MGQAVIATPKIRADILACVRNLRASAVSLTGRMDQADDLVQETLLKALSNLDKFQAGTNMQAWLYTILRNEWYSTHRRRKREVQDPDGIAASQLSSLPEQNGRLDLADMRRALAQLPPEQREAVLLVGAEGYSYEEAARICGTQIGTIKSRVNRARSRLATLMGLESTDDLGTDRVTMAVIAAE